MWPNSALPKPAHLSQIPKVSRSIGGRTYAWLALSSRVLQAYLPACACAFQAESWAELKMDSFAFDYGQVREAVNCGFSLKWRNYSNTRSRHCGSRSVTHRNHSALDSTRQNLPAGRVDYRVIHIIIILNVDLPCSWLGIILVVVERTCYLQCRWQHMR